MTRTLLLACAMVARLMTSVDVAARSSISTFHDFHVPGDGRPPEQSIHQWINQCCLSEEKGVLKSNPSNSVYFSVLKIARRELER